MVSRGQLFLGLASAAVLVLVIRVYVSPLPHDSSLEKTDLTYRVDTKTNTFEAQADNRKIQDILAVTRELIKQRNDLSRQLNQKQQKLGQLDCEKQLANELSTSGTGGWCMNSSKEDGGQHLTDTPLVTQLADFFKGKSVGSFGDGPGRYKQLLMATGMVKSYDAYDGAPYTDTTSEGRVTFLDLTIPQYGLPLYDWIVSLEVAEHIPEQYERVYIDNIVRHAREGVVLSWAVPGQGGFSHVNTKTKQYVIDLFDAIGFSYDDKATVTLQRAATLPWLQANIAVYRRRDYTKIDKDKLYFS